MVVDRNSKQRFFLCDTVLGTTFCEFGSAHEGIDAAAGRSSWEDATWHATAFAERYWLHEHPRRHSSGKESTRMKFMSMRSECSKMRSESSEYMWKTTGVFFPKKWRIKIALESYFEERAQEICESNLRKTTLICAIQYWWRTVLKLLREQFKEDDQRKTAGEIAGLVPETSLELETILKEREGFWWGRRWIFAWRSGDDY